MKNLLILFSLTSALILPIQVNAQDFGLSAEVRESAEKMKAIETNSLVEVNPQNSVIGDEVSIKVVLLETNKQPVAAHQVVINVFDKNQTRVEQTQGVTNSEGVFQTTFFSDVTGEYRVEVWDNYYESPFKLLQEPKIVYSTISLDNTPVSLFQSFFSSILGFISSLFK